MSDGREMKVAQMLWEMAGAADPHFPTRALATSLSAHSPSRTELEVRTLLQEVLLVFERLGREHPEVLLPFLGRLLNEAQEP